MKRIFQPINDVVEVEGELVSNYRVEIPCALITRNKVLYPLDLDRADGLVYDDHNGTVTVRGIVKMSDYNEKILANVTIDGGPVLKDMNDKTKTQRVKTP